MTGAETSLRACLIACAVVLASAIAVVVAHSPQNPPQQAPPTFRGSTDLVLVETHVVARDGTPIPGLKAEQFEVFIDGRRRPLVSAEFTVAGGSKGGGGAAPAAAATLPTSPVRDGRIIVLAIDEASFPFTARASAKEAATRVVDRAAPEDYVGLIAYPDNVEVAPSRDRTKIREAIARLVGLRVEAIPSPFSISASEAVDLRSRTPIATKEIVDRECRRDAGNPACRQQVIQAGTDISNTLEQQALISITGLHRVVEAMGSLPGRKSLVVVSAGLPMSNAPGSKLNLDAETTRIAHLAAAANINLYVFYMNVHFITYYSPAYGKINHTIFDDISLFGTGLEIFADSGGGAFFQIEVDPDPFVDRVMRETSAFYLLGVQTEPSMRDGKQHTIRVTVKQKGADVRYRRAVTIPK